MLNSDVTETCCVRWRMLSLPRFQCGTVYKAADYLFNLRTQFFLSHHSASSSEEQSKSLPLPWILPERPLDFAMLAAKVGFDHTHLSARGMKKGGENRLPCYCGR